MVYWNQDNERSCFMKCVKCGHEMEGGYSLRLALAGTVKIEKMEIKKNSMQPEVCVCPNCGKVEIYVDPQSRGRFL